MEKIHPNAEWVALLAERYYPYIYTVAYWRTSRNSHLAEDLAQDTFLRVLIQQNPNWPADTPTDQKRYLHSFLQSAIKDRFRRDHRDKRDIDLEISYDTPNFGKTLSTKSAEDQVLAQIDPPSPSVEVTHLVNSLQVSEWEASRQMAALSGRPVTEVRRIIQRWRGERS